MDFSSLSGLILVVVGAVLLVTAIQLYTFWASEALLDVVKQRVVVKVSGISRSIPFFSFRRRKTA